jgi:hypothetical protein
MSLKIALTDSLVFDYPILALQIRSFGTNYRK